MNYGGLPSNLLHWEVFHLHISLRAIMLYYVFLLGKVHSSWSCSSSCGTDFVDGIMQNHVCIIAGVGVNSSWWWGLVSRVICIICMTKILVSVGSSVFSQFDHWCGFVDGRALVWCCSSCFVSRVNLYVPWVLTQIEQQVLNVSVERATEMWERQKKSLAL